MCVIYYSSLCPSWPPLYPLEPPTLVSQTLLQNCTRPPMAQAAALSSPTRFKFAGAALSAQAAASAALEAFLEEASSAR